MKTTNLEENTWKRKRNIVITKNGNCVLVTTVYTGHTTLHEYETMVFSWNPWTKRVGSYDDYDFDTYDYPDVADVGHEQMVAKWMNEDRPLHVLRQERLKKLH